MSYEEIMDLFKDDDEMLRCLYGGRYRPKAKKVIEAEPKEQNGCTILQFREVRI